MDKKALVEALQAAKQNPIAVERVIDAIEAGEFEGKPEPKQAAPKRVETRKGAR